MRLALISLLMIPLAFGCKGEKGDVGPAGEDGSAGADGEDGSAGADGEDGSAGADGEDGDAGEDGPDGDAGVEYCSGSRNLSEAVGCTYIEGGLTIESTPVTDLSMLSELRGIGGGLQIRDNPVLTSLHGLENLRTIVGTLYITENNALENIDAVFGLTYLYNLRELHSNPSLCTSDAEAFQAHANSIGALLYYVEIYSNADC